MLRNLDTIYYKPDLVRISQPKLISARTFFWFTEVFKCGPILTGKGAAAPFIGVYILGEIRPAGGFDTLPNVMGGPNWAIYPGPKNQPYHNQPLGASLCSANWTWDGAAALFVVTEIRGNIICLTGIPQLAHICATFINKLHSSLLTSLLFVP